MHLTFSSSDERRFIKIWPRLKYKLRTMPEKKMRATYLLYERLLKKGIQGRNIHSISRCHSRSIQTYICQLLVGGPSLGLRIGTCIAPWRSARGPRTYTTGTRSSGTIGPSHQPCPRVQYAIIAAAYSAFFSSPFAFGFSCG